MNRCRLAILLPVILVISTALVAPVVPAAAQAGSTPAVKPKPDSRYGNILFKAPPSAAWRRAAQNDRVVFSAPLPPPDFCEITLFEGNKLAGDFRKAFVHIHE